MTLCVLSITIRSISWEPRSLLLPDSARMTSIVFSPDFIALYAILRFKEENAISGNALRLEELLNSPGSPGKAFNLDTFSLLEILRRLESRGLLRVIRTSGLDEVRIESKMPPIECIVSHYEEVG